MRGTLPLSSPIYELDGTSAGSRNPATRPAQNSEMAPLAGAALVRRLAGGPWSARLSFREIWSATADRQPGEPASGVNEEVVSLTATAVWRNRIFLSGGLRYNVLFDELDDEQLALRVKLTPRQWLTLEHDFLAPTFDGDSIWNIFSTGAYRDLRASYEVGAARRREGLRAGFARFFLATGDEIATFGPYAGQDVGAEAPGGRFAAGGSLGAAWRNARGMWRADGYWDDGYGGRKVGVDATTRVKVRTPLELEGRLTGYYWRNDLQPTPNGSGVVFGAQAGGRYQMGKGVRLHLLSKTTSAPTTKASFAGWPCWSSTRRYEALGDTAGDGRRLRRGRGGRGGRGSGDRVGLAGDDRGRAGGARCPGRPVAAARRRSSTRPRPPPQVRSRGPRAPRRDLRGLPRSRPRGRRSRATT